MDPSLSIILPVYNAEDSLPQQVHRLLEILPDLVGTFEVLIVDHASTDHTQDVALDLAREFPQVRVTRSTTRQSTSGVVPMVLGQTTGDVIFVQDGNAAVSAQDLRQLWSLRHQADLVAAHAPAQPELPESRLMQRLSDWGSMLKKFAARNTVPSGIQMFRRPSLDESPDCVRTKLRPAIERLDRRLDSVGANRPSYVSSSTSVAVGE